MKKFIILPIMAGLILMTMTISFAIAEGISSDPDLLGGAEKATPANWESDVLVWKTGKIDGIYTDGISIDDIRYLITVGTALLDKTGILLNMNNFNQGTTVTFVLDTSREKIVTLIKGDISEENHDNQGAF
jgi:hypothetical protein